MEFDAENLVDGEEILVAADDFSEAVADAVSGVAEKLTPAEA